MPATVQTLINNLCDRLGWSTADSAKRAIALEALNVSEKYISQQGSFLYLSKRSSLSVNSGASSAAAPADFDYGKAATLVGDAGPLEYLPLGDFDAAAVRAAGNLVRTDRPGYWTFAFSGTTATIFVKPTNGTGSSLSLTFVYQKFVADLADTGSSFSLLPEGVEKTLLLDRAEWWLKDKLGIPMRPKFIADLEDQLQAFYNAQRATKPEAQTDPEIVAAKTYERQLKPGV